jgi:hypothetical protein
MSHIPRLRSHRRPAFCVVLIVICSTAGWAQQTIQGDLTVTGTVTANAAKASSTNNVLNASLFAGSDIGAQVNAAFASCTNVACQVMIPSGSYSYSTTIALPKNPLTTLEFEAGAVLSYTGTSYAMTAIVPAPDWQPGAYQGNYKIIGAGHIIGNPNAKAGLFLYGTNGLVVRDLAIDSFTNGDGVLNAGINSFTLEGMKITFNLVGVHIMASPGAASNNGLIARNVIASNTWGVIDGDMSNGFPANWLGLGLGPGGVSSPNFGNVYLSNDLEANTAGAIITGLTTADQFIGNYFESSPRGIVIGGGSVLTAAQYTALYNKQPNGGSSQGTSVTGNYFTSSSTIHSLVELRAAGAPVIDRNGTDGSGTTCFVDIYIVGSGLYIGLNYGAGVTNQVCQGGTLNPNFLSTIPTGLSLGAGGLSTPGPVAGSVVNATAVTNAFNLGPSTFTLNSLGKIGPIVFFALPSAPNTTCAGASVAVGSWGIAVCQNGTWTQK